MKSTLPAWLAIPLLVLCGCGEPSPDSSALGGSLANEESGAEDFRDAEPVEIDQINSCFRKYNQTLLDRNGLDAVGYVDEQTIAYYENLRQHALTASPEIVRSQRLVDQFGILLVRQKLEEHDLSSMTGRDLFIIAVNDGWNSTEFIDQLALGRIRVADGSAFARIVLDNNETDYEWQFVKQDGEWRVSFVASLDIIDWAYREIAKQSRVTDDEFVKSMVGTATGKTITDDAWLPLKQAEGD